MLLCASAFVCIFVSHGFCCVGFGLCLGAACV